MSETNITDLTVEQRLNKIGTFLDANENKKVRDAWNGAWNVYEYWCVTPEDREGSREDLDSRLMKLENYVEKAKSSKKNSIKQTDKVEKAVEIDWYKVESILVAYIRHKFQESGYLCNVDDISVVRGGVFSSVIYIYKCKGETAKLLLKSTLEARCHWADAEAENTVEAVKVGKGRLDEEIYNIVQDLKKIAASQKKVYKTDILEVYKALAGGNPKPFDAFTSKFGIDVARELEVAMGRAIERVRGQKNFKNLIELKKFYLDQQTQVKFLEYVRKVGFEFSERGKTIK